MTLLPRIASFTLGHLRDQLFKHPFQGTTISMAYAGIYFDKEFKTMTINNDRNCPQPSAATTGKVFGRHRAGMALVALMGSLLLVGCGGGNDSGNGDPGQGSSSDGTSNQSSSSTDNGSEGSSSSEHNGDDDGTPAVTYHIGGTASGLADEGLVLSLDTGAKVITLNVRDSAFTFPETVPDGTTYTVKLEDSPSESALKQDCTVQGGSGTVSGEDVTGISVTCDLKPWATRLHHGALHARTDMSNIRSVTVEWPDQSAEYTLFLTTDLGTDLTNPAAYDAITVPNAESGHVFEALEPGENVYIALEVDGVIQSWTSTRPNVVGFDGMIETIAIDPETDTKYIGGKFHEVGTLVGHGILLPDANGSDHLLAFPEVNDTVRVAVADGRGGWYIGGHFTHVGGKPRNGLAQVDAQGRVTDWNPDAGGNVIALAVADGLIYAGGEFNSVGGEERDGLAAIDNEGTVTDWNPGVNYTVYALAPADGVVYVGGSFTSVNGEPRQRLAAVDSDGQLTDWNPGADDVVHAMVASGDQIYIGGEFTSVGSDERNHLAAVDANGNVTSWNPDASSPVRALVVDDGLVYAGGEFGRVGGEWRRGVAVIDTDGNVTTWDADRGDYSDFYSLTLADDVLYAGGRDGVVAIDTEGEVLDWAHNTGNVVFALSASDGAVYAGGIFNLSESEERSYLVAIDGDGNLTNWNPDPDSVVYSVLPADGLVYIGGAFSSFAGETRNGLVAIDSQGSVTDWAPSVTEGRVNTLAAHEGFVYVGGTFTMVDGQERNRLAAINTEGELTGWAPDANGSVLALAAIGGRIYAGGYFSSVNGEERDFAALDASGDLIDAVPDVDGRVHALTEIDGLLYLGGDFSSVGAETRFDLAAIDAEGNVTDWAPVVGSSTFDSVHALAEDGGLIYVGGDFSSINGKERFNLAAVDTDGNVTDWAPEVRNTLTSLLVPVAGGVYALAVADGIAHAGGWFTVVGEHSRSRSAAIDTEDNVID